MATRTIAITEVKANLLKLVTEIGETGDEIVITRHGREVAKLTPAGPFAELRGALILPDDLSELWSAGAEDWEDPVEKYDRKMRGMLRPGATEDSGSDR